MDLRKPGLSPDQHHIFNDYCPEDAKVAHNAAVEKGLGRVHLRVVGHERGGVYECKIGFYGSDNESWQAHIATVSEPLWPSNPMSTLQFGSFSVQSEELPEELCKSLTEIVGSASEIMSCSGIEVIHTKPAFYDVRHILTSGEKSRILLRSSPYSGQK